MGEEEKKEETALTVNEEKALEQLRAGSGESEANNFPFIPEIQIDNSTIPVKVEGKDEPVDILCDPQYSIRERVDGEIVSHSFEKEFTGVILVIKYKVQKKYKQGSTTPFFFSQEFSPRCFNDDSLIKLRHVGQDDVEELTYKQIKEKYGDTKTLLSSIYVLIGDEVKKVILKGSSLAVLWDYLKNFKGKDSVSAHMTKFTSHREKDPKDYNKMGMELVEDAEIDFGKVLTMQQEVNKIFEHSSGDAVEAEVVEEDSDEVNVEEIPFK